MKVLVTGGTGYLGSAVVEALAAHGHSPVVFSRRAAAVAPPRTAFAGDVRDLEALTRAAAGCDAICHTAALVSLWRPRREEFDEVNVGGLRNAVAAAERLRIPRLLYTSSFLALPPQGAAVPQRSNDYQRTKVDAHAAAIDAIGRGVPMICVYPGVVYGPGEATEGNFVRKLVADHLAGKLPGLVGADAAWSYAFVDDVALGHVRALEHGRIGGRYLLGGENAPQRRVFEIVRELTGRPMPRRIPDGVARLVGSIEEIRSRLFRVPPQLTRKTVDILTSDWSLDSSLAIAELGYRITPLETGIARLVQSLGRTVAS